MTVVLAVLPSLLILLAVLIAVAPWGVAKEAEFVLQVMPYMMAHLFLARRRGLVLSPIVFLAGIGMDIASDGPLGFWALVYLFGVLVARQLPDGLLETRLGRFSALLLVVFALAAAQVGIASLYLLNWIDWHPVLAGTLAAGCITLLIDLAWQERSADRPMNVTVRGAGRGAAHV